MNTPLDLQAIRHGLQQERARLIQHLADDGAKLSQPIGGTPDPADLARFTTAREVQSVILAQSREHLEQVETALRRLDEGTYGLCIRCDKPINPERLEALPYAVTCMQCQAARD